MTNSETTPMDPSFNQQSLVEPQTPLIPLRLVAPLAGLLMVAAGTIDMQMITWMNRQQVPPCEGCVPKYFEAPFFQTWIVHLGGLMLFPFYYFTSRPNASPKFGFPSSSSSLIKLLCPRWLWIVPTMFDVTSTVASNYSMLFVDPATARMLMAFNVFITFGLRIFWLRRVPKLYELLGVGVVTAGMISAAVYALINPTIENDYVGMQWLGVLMTIVATILSSIQFVFEERLFANYHATPFEAVAWMGLFGSIIGAMLLVLGELTGFESMSTVTYQMGLGLPESHRIIGACFCYLFSVALFNISSVVVVKVGSAVLRGVVNAARTVTLWAVQLILGEAFNWLMFASMLVIIIGVTLYNYNYFFQGFRRKWDASMCKDLYWLSLSPKQNVKEETFAIREETRRI